MSIVSNSFFHTFLNGNCENPFRASMQKASNSIHVSVKYNSQREGRSDKNEFRVARWQHNADRQVQRIQHMVFCHVAMCCLAGSREMLRNPRKSPRPAS